MGSKCCGVPCSGGRALPDSVRRTSPLSLASMAFRKDVLDANGPRVPEGRARFGGTQNSLRTSSVLKPRSVSVIALPRPATTSASFAAVSSSGASTIAT